MTENKFEDIYDVVKLIPKGRVSTYGSIAEYLGSKGGARLVGWAMNACHGRADVPAHRVVNASGVLTGKNFFATPILMQELLESEGVSIKNDKVQDFKNVVWKPVEELL
jgi:methylated-DNA-protein-cysteine methyltransferase-like protein